MVTHRSDARAQRALQSVAWASEILILDNASGLNFTALQARGLPVRRIDTVAEVDDFAAARNRLIAAAREQWILFLDSDEYLTEDAPLSIQRAIKHAPKSVAGFRLRRIDHFLDEPLRHGEVGTVWKPRLIRTNAARYHRAIHETATINGSVEHLSVLIHHEAHTSISDFLQTLIKYSQLEAQLRSDNSPFLTRVQLLLFPPAKFLQNFILRRGFLDGMRGLLYALLMSLHSWSIRVMLLTKDVE